MNDESESYWERFKEGWKEYTWTYLFVAPVIIIFNSQYSLEGRLFAAAFAYPVMGLIGVPIVMPVQRLWSKWTKVSRE